MKDIKFLQKYQEEFLSRMDLEDMNLQTYRLFQELEPVKVPEKKKGPVPELDFTKIYEWREQQNAEEEEEEMEVEGEDEFEEESDVRTENKHLFPDGTQIESQCSQDRK